TFVAPAVTTPGAITVDPDNAMPELDETNNATAFQLGVDDPGLTVSLAAAPTAAGPASAIGLTVGFVNAQTSARALTVTLDVVDATGATADAIASSAAVIAAPGSSGFASAWNTGNHLAGTYGVRATVFEAGRFVAQAVAAVSVLPEVATEAS